MTMLGWLTGVKTYLATEFPSCEVVLGERKDRRWQGEQDLIAVWWPGWDELTRDVALAQPTLQLRYFPAKSKQPALDTPHDPTDLVVAGDLLLAAFPRPTTVPGFFTDGLACRLSTLRPNYAPDVWRVDGTLVAYTLGASA